MADSTADSLKKARELLVSVLEGTMSEATRLEEAYRAAEKSPAARAEARVFEDFRDLAASNYILAQLCEGLIEEINATDLIDRLMAEVVSGETEREGTTELADYEARLRAFRPCADCSTEIGCFEADESRCP